MKIITSGHYALANGYEWIKFQEKAISDTWKKKLKVLKQIVDQENNNLNIEEWLDLESEWWRGLNSCLNPIKLTHGTQGEETLMLRLLLKKLKDHLCIPKLMIGNDLDVDLVIIGPKGVWVLESKYISGEIFLRNGEWFREKIYHMAGGHKKIVMDDLGDIEQEWLRGKEEVSKTISDSFPALLDRHPNLVRGGIAFTHKNCVGIDVDSSSSVNWGTITMWVGDINKPRVGKWRPVRPFLSKEQIIGIADALLEISIEFQAGQKRPAYKIAEDVVDRRYRKLWKIFFDNKGRYSKITGLKLDCPFLKADSLDQAYKAELDQALDQAIDNYFGLVNET